MRIASQLVKERRTEHIACIPKVFGHERMFRRNVVHRLDVLRYGKMLIEGLSLAHDTYEQQQGIVRKRRGPQTESWAKGEWGSSMTRVTSP